MTTDGLGNQAAGSCETPAPIFWQPATLGFVLVILCFAAVGDESSQARHPEEREGAAKIIHKGDVVHDRSTNTTAPMRLWPLYSSPDARMNYVEVASRSGLHFHPDADHKLYVLEGRVVVNAGTNTTIASAGDLIIIPKGVRHYYDVAAKGERALLLTFDAPPYDPRKTINLEPANERK